MTIKDQAMQLRKTFGELAPEAVAEIKSALISYGEDSDELQNMDSEFRWWDEVENELKLL